MHLQGLIRWHGRWPVGFEILDGAILVSTMMRALYPAMFAANLRETLEW